MEELKPNFTTVTNCEAFKITSKMLEERLKIAKSEGREYGWSPLDDDYCLPEKDDFNYEIACPNFDVVQSEGKPYFVEVYAVFEYHQGYRNLCLAFAKVFQFKGEKKLQEFIDIARMYSYMRFCLRDHVRDLDKKWWNDFLFSNVVSNETTVIFTEDKLVANTWANRTFPNNNYNAWIGKCGEFVFATWAGECGLSISRVDLKDHPSGDEYDFSHWTLLTKEDGSILKLDIKTFQLDTKRKRNWWNVNQNCLVGEHRQDVIIFVVIDEDFRMGKVVGYLLPDTILKNAEYISPHLNYNPYAKGYYKVYLSAIYNPYYLRALLDSPNQALNGLFFAFEPNKVFTEIIKDYPLDPMTAYNLSLSDDSYSNLHYYDPTPGGINNLTAKPTLKLFINNPIY
ncbi:MULTISPECIES: hypothetical protein [unclassified Nodularia (in: cyanobacteria)]|uniref:hypothetical protein n=1 Tax=unclassified Nodularia (in: cyanobacteria) TaxID=2656917 RepID=UPI001881E776|nr:MULTISPECIES: hypothetical protein [unclassified Nodularia (in: cyanobacteria)]MBE9199569.1 hypothetical protein [Nodularia sp. LEGE 06071]MCC2691382.1 hypothetical protein [Nodularia sp. LEGE 04288]